jgi:hypothetical protein
MKSVKSVETLFLNGFLLGNNLTAVLRCCVDGSDNRLGKFLFQIIEATRGGMPARDGNRSPRDDGSWGSRAKDFVICAEAALRGKKGDPYPLNNSSLGRWVG